MNKTRREFLLDHGYCAVSNIEDAVKQEKVFDLFIDVHNSDPVMLLARVHEEKAIIILDNTDIGSRITITRSDRFNTHIFDVPVSCITDVIMEVGKNMTTILFNVKDSCYTYKLCYQN